MGVCTGLDGWEDLRGVNVGKGLERRSDSSISLDSSTDFTDLLSASLRGSGMGLLSVPWGLLGDSVPWGLLGVSIPWGLLGVSIPWGLLGVSIPWGLLGDSETAFSVASRFGGGGLTGGLLSSAFFTESGRGGLGGGCALSSEVGILVLGLATGEFRPTSGSWLLEVDNFGGSGLGGSFALPSPSDVDVFLPPSSDLDVFLPPSSDLDVFLPPSSVFLSSPSSFLDSDLFTIFFSDRMRLLPFANKLAPLEL